MTINFKETIKNKQHYFLIVLGVFLLSIFAYASYNLITGNVVGSTDTDGDGIADELDNCLNKSNPAQIDTNSDGYGNACDADYNNDGVIGGPEF